MGFWGTCGDSLGFMMLRGEKWSLRVFVGLILRRDLWVWWMRRRLINPTWGFGGLCGSGLVFTMLRGGEVEPESICRLDFE